MLIIGILPRVWPLYISGTFDPTLTWTDSAGNPINLTGYRASMDIRSAVGAATLIDTLTTENGGITIPDPTTGVMNFLITDEATANFTPGRAVMDLRLVTASGRVYYLFQGAINMQQMVTT